MPQKNEKIQRMHHFDVLRSVMLLLIVLTHATHAYDPTREWIVESPDQTWLAPVLASIPLFSMPGFFMISSLLSIFLIRKRGYDNWASGRMLRVYVPLLSGIAILGPITIYIASIAAQVGAAGETSSPFTGDFVTDLSVIDRRWIGHLWFLSTLGAFTILAWIGFARFRLMHRLESFADFLVSINARVNIWWTIVLFIGAWEFGAKAFMYIVKLVLGYEPALVAILNVDTLLGYFPLFLLGLLLGVSGDLRTLMFKVTPFRTIVLFLGFAIYALAAGVQNDEWRIARKFIGPALGTGIALFLFGYLANKIKKPGPVVKWISSYSYSVYLLHYPITNAIALVLVSVSVTPSIEFLIAVFATYALSFVAAWGVGQIRYLKFLFNGEPFWSRPKSSSASPASIPEHSAGNA